MSSSTVEGQSQTTEPRIQALRQRAHHLVNTVHTLQRRCDELGHQDAAWHSQQQALHDQIATLTHERDQLQSERDALAANQQALNSQRASLQAKLNALQEQRDAMQTERDSLQVERKDLSGKLRRLTSEKQELINTLEDLDCQINAIRAENEELEQDRDTLHSKWVAIANSNSRLSVEHEELRRKLDEISSGWQERSGCLATLKELAHYQLSSLTHANSHRQPGSQIQGKAEKDKSHNKRLLARVSGTTTALNQNRAHYFAAAHALCHYQSNAIFTFIPKNACTTLRYSLACANGAIHGRTDFQWIHGNNHTFRADNLREILSAEYTFVVLRNPFSRLASYFYDKLTGTPSASSDLSYKIARTIFSCDDDTMTFRSFVHQLWSSPDKLKEDEHIRPQVDFLVYQDYDDWFCVEKLDDAAKTIQAKIGLELIDTREFSSHTTYGMQIVDQDGLTDATIKNLRKMRDLGQAPRWASMYDEETAFRVASLYLNDIRLYCHHFTEQALGCDLISIASQHAGK